MRYALISLASTFYSAFWRSFHIVVVIVAVRNTAPRCGLMACEYTVQCIRATNSISTLWPSEFKSRTTAATAVVAALARVALQGRPETERRRGSFECPERGLKASTGARTRARTHKIAARLSRLSIFPHSLVAMWCLCVCVCVATLVVIDVDWRPATLVSPCALACGRLKWAPRAAIEALINSHRSRGSARLYDDDDEVALLSLGKQFVQSTHTQLTSTRALDRLIGDSFNLPRASSRRG